MPVEKLRPVAAGARREQGGRLPGEKTRGMDLEVLELELELEPQQEVQQEASGPETSARPCQRMGPALGWG